MSDLEIGALLVLPTLALTWGPAFVLWVTDTEQVGSFRIDKDTYVVLTGGGLVAAGAMFFFWFIVVPVAVLVGLAFLTRGTVRMHKHMRQLHKVDPAPKNWPKDPL